MKNKMSQSGFTLIELIAVMVILGILAAVIIPRISTLTSGAYESNVRTMFGVIKNEVNAQAIKAAMTGGAGGHRERFPSPQQGAAQNYYLDTWVDEYDDALWSEDCIANVGWTNVNKALNEAHITAPDVQIFGYFPHGITSKNGWGGSSLDEEDVYWIYYMPITTLKGEANGYDHDGFVMIAAHDKDMDTAPSVTIVIDESGDIVATGNGDDILTDITYISENANL